MQDRKLNKPGSCKQDHASGSKGDGSVGQKKFAVHAWGSQVKSLAPIPSTHIKKGVPNTGYVIYTFNLRTPKVEADCEF